MSAAEELSPLPKVERFHKHRTHAILGPPGGGGSFLSYILASVTFETRPVLCWRLEDGREFTDTGLGLARRGCACNACLLCLSWYSAVATKQRAKGALVNETYFRRHAAAMARRRKTNG